MIENKTNKKMKNITIKDGKIKSIENGRGYWERVFDRKGKLIWVFIPKKEN